MQNHGADHHDMHHDDEPGPGPGKDQGGPSFGLHGMLIVGEETVYLSHFPMFMFDPEDHAHNFQVILKVTFTNKGSDLQADYVEDRKKHRETKVYSLQPVPFAITELDPEHLRRRSFEGTIHRGHFERGGTPILDVVVNVESVVLFRPFDLHATKPSELQYLLFGRGPDVFLAHLITRPPDFDQVVSVRVIDPEFTDEELSRGVRVTFPRRANSPRERIKEGQTSGEIAGQGEKGPEPSKLLLEARVELYFEEGELSSPPTFEQTKEEQSAGF